MTSRNITNIGNSKLQSEAGMLSSYRPRTPGVAICGGKEEETEKDLLSDDDNDELDEVRVLVRELVNEIIRKSGDKYVLWSKHKKNGKHRKLGTHSSKKSAQAQERAIHAHRG